jgi:hypothetical protein
MSAPRQDFIAQCHSCGRPFVMGQAGRTGTQIGTTGEMYVEELVFHGDQIAMKGVQGRCPHCGGMGQIPDGVYGLVANGYTVLSALTLPDVQRLASLLRRFTEDEAATDEDILAAVPTTPASSFDPRWRRTADSSFWASCLQSRSSSRASGPVIRRLRTYVGKSATPRRASRSPSTSRSATSLKPSPRRYDAITRGTA